MLVPGLVFASPEMMEDIVRDQALRQVINVAHLPGILSRSIGMPDIHWGYGFPIGGVAAMDVDEGVISPGGVGYDINCGVRLLRSNLEMAALRPRLPELAAVLHREVPSGVGKTGFVRLNRQEIDKVLAGGSRWAASRGYATEEDVESTESGGKLSGADPDAVSDVAIVASGTATLETALRETPMVVVYKVSALSYAIGRRFISVDHISLVNLIAGRTVVPELIQDDASPERIAAEVRELIVQRAKAREMKSALAEIRGSLGTPGASARTARIACDML